MEEQKITIDARPEPLAIDKPRAAILVIDMQNDFGSKGGMFDRAGIDISMIQRAVGPTAKVLAAGRLAGIPIVYIKMAFQPDLSDAGPVDSPNWKLHDALDVGKTIRLPDGRESHILIRDCWNTDIVPELAPRPGDVVLYKHRYSGFYQTELDTIFRKLNAKISCRHRLHHECLRGINNPRRNVPGLYVPSAGRLTGRACWRGSTQNES